MVLFTLWQAMKTNSGSKGMAELCFCTSALDRVCGQRIALAALVPVHIIQKAEGASRSIWTGAEISTAKGFDRRTLQSVVSLYSDCSFPIHQNLGILNKAGNVHMT